MDGRNERIVTRQHPITLFPDLLLFFVSLVFLLEMRMLPDQKPFTARMLCEGAAVFFMVIGLVDVVKWFGFHVILTPDCIEIQRFWIFKKAYCENPARPLTIHPVQEGWDVWMDKGTLVIYEPGGVVATLDNLGDFSRIAHRSFSPMEHLRFASGYDEI